MKGWFDRARELQAQDWGWLLAAMMLLPLLELSLRAMGYQRTRDLLQRFLPPQPPGQTNDQDRSPGDVTADVTAQRVARMVSLAARHGPCRSTCLRQALAAWWLLGRRGVTTDLHIGVKNDADGFAAHAWVRRNGRTVLGGEDSDADYTPLRI